MRQFLTAVLLAVALRGSAQTLTIPHDTAHAARIAKFPGTRTATWVAVASTLVPAVAGAVIGANSSRGNAGAALFVGGLVIGPAAGFWYGGVSGKAWPGLLLRTGGLVIAAAGAADCLGDLLSRSGCSGGANAAIIGGSLLVVGSAIYDIATVGGKVRAHNAAMVRAMVVPLFSPSERRVGVGIVIVGI